MKDIAEFIKIDEEHLPADQFLAKLKRDAEAADKEERQQERQIVSPSHTIPVSRKPRRFKNWLRLAAVLMVLAIPVVAYMVFQTRDREAIAVQYRTETTGPGETKHITLSDSSSLFLNAASSVTYPTDLSNAAPVINFTGEVFFKVAPRPTDKPLIVRSGILEIEVHGTEFNVDAYKDSTFKVTLSNGNITIFNGKEKKKLHGNQLAIVNKDYIPVIDLDNAKSEISWIRDTFSMALLPLPEIMNKLETWYGVHIRYEGFTEERENFKYSVPYSHNDSITLVLDRLERVQYFEYQPKNKPIKRGDTIVIINKP